MEFVEENLVDGVKVREHKHYPCKDDVGKAIYPRLKIPQKRSESRMLGRVRSSFSRMVSFHVWKSMREIEEWIE